MNVKKFVKEENQLKTIDNFKKLLPTIDLDIILISLSLGLNMNLDKLKTFSLNNITITETEVYKKYSKIFFKIYYDNFDKFDLFKPFGFSEEELQEFRHEKPDKNKLANLLNEKFNLDIDPDSKINKINMKDFVFNMTSKVDKNTNKQLNDSIYFSVEQINIILNGITDYVEIDKQKKEGDENLKDYLSMNLYKDVFEIYLKILKDIYAKENNIKLKRVKNKLLYPYFQEKYPELLDSVNNKLRNDVCHLNYDARGEYTRDQIDKARTDILLKSVTALIARNEFIIDFFDKSINVEEKMNVFMDKIFEVVENYLDMEDKKHID